MFFKVSHKVAVDGVVCSRIIHGTNVREMGR